MPCFGSSRCYQLEGSLVSLISSASGAERSWGARGATCPHPPSSCFTSTCAFLLLLLCVLFCFLPEYEVQTPQPSLPSLPVPPPPPQPAPTARLSSRRPHRRSLPAPALHKAACTVSLSLSRAPSPSPPPLGFLTLPLLLPLLELPEPPSPRIPPLYHQAGFVRNDAALVGRVLVVAQQQILLHGLDFGALARYVLGVDPQGLVSAPYPVAPLFVDGDDVDRELPPVGIFFRFQDVDLDSWKKENKTTRQERKRCYDFIW